METNIKYPIKEEIKRRRRKAYLKNELQPREEGNEIGHSIFTMQYSIWLNLENPIRIK